MKDIVESIIKTPVESNLLKYAAGQAIFCPNCDNIMDWRRTVVATIHAIKPGAEEQIVRSYTVCGKCWDKLGQHVTSGVEQANAKLGSKGISARVEIVDGRETRFDDID